MSGHHLHARTDPGRAREVNEDCVRVEVIGERRSLIVVCDGLGGLENGEVASQLAADVIAAHLREASPADPRAAVFDALTLADRAVTEHPGEGASTAVVALVDHLDAWVGWVGDCRLLHLSRGAIVDRTRDHTRVAEWVDAGQLTEADAAEHPERHVVTRALGSGTARPDVWGDPVRLAPGDALILASDGLHDLVAEDEIPSLVAGLTVRDAVERLVDLANARGGFDNITVAMLVAGSARVGGATLIDEPDDEAPPRRAHTATPAPRARAAPTAPGPTPAVPPLPDPDAPGIASAPPLVPSSPPANAAGRVVAIGAVAALVLLALVAGLAVGFVAGRISAAPADANVAPADANVAPADANVAPADVPLAPADAPLAPPDGNVAPDEAPAGSAP